MVFRKEAGAVSPPRGAGPPNSQVMPITQGSYGGEAPLGQGYAHNSGVLGGGRGPPKGKVMPIARGSVGVMVNAGQEWSIMAVNGQCWSIMLDNGQ